MEALSLLLNIVYENVFLTNSHGFRRGRAPKLALAFFRICSTIPAMIEWIKLEAKGFGRVLCQSFFYVRES